MSHEPKFLEFHNTNPHVYEKLVGLARQAKSKGHNRIGIRMLWEVLRWDTMINTKSTDFKLNDHFHSYYARMIMATNPDLVGIFEVRG